METDEENAKTSTGSHNERFKMKYVPFGEVKSLKRVYSLKWIC